MAKRITVTYEDSISLTNSEIESNLESKYGKNCKIKIEPISNSFEALVHFAVDLALTEEQALIFFDQPELYPQKLKSLRHTIIKRFLYVLNDVIMENEDKFSS